METIIIKSNQSSIIIKLNNNKCTLYTFDNIIINPILAIKKYYHMLIANNQQSNIAKLFINNGEYIINYLEKEKEQKTNLKKFIFKDITIICSLLGLILLSKAATNESQYTYENIGLYQTINYDLLDLKNAIFSSNKLTLEEKNYLYNEDFLTDIIDTINTSNIMKYFYQNKFKDITIENYTKSQDDSLITKGYYTLDNPNTLYIKNYTKLDTYSKDIVSHEFIHLCQDTTGYNLIIEACAEIISNEYYNDAKNLHYQKQVKIIKKLMEIIGPEPIWYYNFTGDFTKIEQLTKPYLTDYEYNLFLDSLTFDLKDEETNEKKYTILNMILKKLYKQIFNKNIEEDLIISLIEKDDNNLVRYYFNHRLINKENSYYIDITNSTYQTIDYSNELCDELVKIYAITEKNITNEKAFELIQTNNYDNYNITRKIDYDSANINITRKTNKLGKTYISGTINGIKYDQIDIDELVANNIIKVNYYLTSERKLTFQEYHNHQYEDFEELLFSCSNTTIINDDSITGYIPQKIYLPTISDKFKKSTNKKLIKF